MVFINKFVYFICCFIGLGGRSNRIKDSSSFDPARTQKLCGPDEDPTVDGIDEGLEEGGGGGAAVCCVCLLRLKEEPETRVLPCTHEFHRICIDRWFSACRCRKTCPVCRFPVEDGRRKYESEEMVEEMVTWFSSFHASGF